MTDERKDWKDTGPIGEVIGETEPTARGYFVRVERIAYNDTGIRIRLTLLCKMQGVTEFRRGIDLTTPLIRKLIPILQRVVAE